MIATLTTDRGKLHVVLEDVVSIYEESLTDQTNLRILFAGIESPLMVSAPRSVAKVFMDNWLRWERDQR